jgi:hypothetical protein
MVPWRREVTRREVTQISALDGLLDERKLSPLESASSEQFGCTCVAGSIRRWIVVAAMVVVGRRVT